MGRPIQWMEKLKSFGFKLGIALLGLLVGFGLLEGLVRWLSPLPRYPYTNVPDEKVGWVAQRGFRGRATNMFGEFDTELRINRDGFRGYDYPLTKPSNTLRIAFLGDSFTFAEQVEEPQTFVRRTETLLNGKLRSKGILNLHIECMNFGIGGYDLQQYVLCYEDYVRKYHPDVVVVAIYVDNDLLGNAFYLLEGGFGRPYFRLVNGALEKVPANMPLMEQTYRFLQQRLRVRWYHHLHLYNKHKFIFWTIRQQLRLREAEKQNRSLPLDQLWKEGGYRNYRYYAVGLNDPVVTEADTLTRLLLERLEKMVQKDGSRWYGMFLPAPENLWPERWPERLKWLPGLEKVTMDFERPFKQVRFFIPTEAARGNLFDTRPALRRAALDEPIFFPRDSHYNWRGQEAVAQALSQWLEPKLFPGIPPKSLKN